MAKRLFKTEDGVEIKPAIRYVDPKSNISSDSTYYYAWYYQDEIDQKWKVGTNKLLYGENREIVICENRDEAVKIANAVNYFIHLLIANIK